MLTLQNSVIWTALWLPHVWYYKVWSVVKMFKNQEMNNICVKIWFANLSNLYLLKYTSRNWNWSINNQPQQFPPWSKEKVQGITLHTRLLFCTHHKEKERHIKSKINLAHRKKARQKKAHFDHYPSTISYANGKTMLYLIIYKTHSDIMLI